MPISDEISPTSISLIDDRHVTRQVSGRLKEINHISVAFNMSLFAD